MNATSNERPILFSGPMVNAILEGQKTQTRRVAKNIQRLDGGIPYRPANNEWGDEIAKCPYGKKCDRLWVRETWLFYEGLYFYRATDMSLIPDPLLQFENPAKWNPSIYMPRKASRLDLLITRVRVEKLQDISEEDAIAEGCPEPFKDYWDSINQKRGFGWDSNPYVWVVNFERV
jgi:hypothetical protein